MLELRNVYTSFNKGTVDEMNLFKDFNLKINKGEFVSIIGSNGSGKTTLLNLICGTYNLDSGTVFFDGKDITKVKEYKRAKHIGRVFQDPKKGTCSNLTILENFALADNKQKRYSLTKAISKKRIDYYRQIISECNMGLEDRMNVKVGTLSGGQRQALALVIAAMTDIDLLILDEHTAALDPNSSETIMLLTDKVVKEKDLTAIMVTHNIRHASTFGNRLLMMNSGEIIMDKSGKEKENTSINDILTVFNEISIEVGN